MATQSSAKPQVQKVPTVDDLRVKLCYICREEEHYDKPTNPPVAWVHPCNCTLVAHESCLLNWIKSAQSDASRTDNALKCPQCSTTYEIVSVRPWGLRLLENFNASLSLAGKVVTASSISIIMLACGAGFYVVLTSYGIYAVQEFIGQEMYDALLTDDPANWPWHAFINLPLIPLTLLASQTRFTKSIPIFPLFLAWTSSPPAQAGAIRLTASNITAYPMQPLIRWPPSPIMVTILLPFVRSLYQRCMKRLRQWILGPQHAELGPVRRLEWALLGGNGPAQLRVEIDENRDRDERDQRQRPNRRPRGQGQDRRNGGGAAARRNDNPNGQADGDGNRDVQGGDDDIDNVAVAEQTVRVNGASFGRFIGSALMLPTVAKWMGSVLYRLSKHSKLLRIFLAINPRMRPPREFGRGWFQTAGRPTGIQQLGMTLRVAFNVICGGTKTWAESDPVWWRNTVGLGIFIFTRDCLNLWHVYLTKQEIESRRVKSRSFASVDIKELDLIKSSEEQATKSSEPTAASSSNDSTQPATADDHASAIAVAS